jgi:hypothetical protein
VTANNQPEIAAWVDVLDIVMNNHAVYPADLVVRPLDYKKQIPWAHTAVFETDQL